MPALLASLGMRFLARMKVQGGAPPRPAEKAAHRLQQGRRNKPGRGFTLDADSLASYPRGSHGIPGRLNGGLTEPLPCFILAGKRISGRARPGRTAGWLATVWLALAAAPATSQSFGLSAPTDRPRAEALFADVTGYDDLLAQVDRYGTVRDPARTELGLVLILRMFRTTCLGLEAGLAPPDILPPGMSAYDEGRYIFGEQRDASGGPVVLSSTGDIDADEGEGHPTIHLGARDFGTTCRIEWTLPGGAPEDRMAGMATFLARWVPYELALAPADRPVMTPDPEPRGYHAWDRPCGARWCPVILSYDLPAGRISLETTLNPERSDP